MKVRDGYLDPENLDQLIGNKKVFINEFKNDVRYFHGWAPTRQVSECVVLVSH